MGRVRFFLYRNRNFVIGLTLFLFLGYLLAISALNPTLDTEEPLLAPKILRGSNNETIYLFDFKKEFGGNGKNKVIFTEFVQVKTAKDLLLAIPAADAVSYYDEAEGKTIGYVSAFGGIGKNFDIVPGKVYEISVRQSTNWSVAAE